MNNRNPLRFRKSETQGRRSSSKKRGNTGRPKPTTARQLAFSILEEFKRTGTFVSQLLEERLDGQRRDFVRRPPLGRQVKSRTKSSDRGSARPAHKTPLSRVDRRFVSLLVNGVVRRGLTLDSILKTYVSRNPMQVEPELWTLLQIGVYQVVLTTGIPRHAAVGETVELARWWGQPQWCGFLNGVLRSIAEDVTMEFVDDPAPDNVPIETRVVPTDPADSTNVWGRPQVRFRRVGKEVFPSFDEHPTAYVSAAFGIPLWLADRWSERFGTEELVNLAMWFERHQSLTLRINRRHGTPQEFIEKITSELAAEDSLTCVPGGRPESVQYDGSCRIVDLPGFSEGEFTVQDETAMAASELLAPQPGESVLDLCAAPGTKTTHLAELMNNDGRIIAADIDGRRIRRIEENATRLGLSIIEPLRIPEDLSDVPNGPFDAALVDVPCSNTGVLGKRPEVRTRLQPTEIEELATLQLRLLEAAASQIRRGGRLVYSTCSIEPEENSGVISSFLKAHEDFEEVETHDFIPGRPSDGGFQALLRRVES